PQNASIGWIEVRYFGDISDESFVRKDVGRFGRICAGAFIATCERRIGGHCGRYAADAHISYVRIVEYDGPGLDVWLRERGCDFPVLEHDAKSQWRCVQSGRLVPDGKRGHIRRRRI